MTTDATQDTSYDVNLRLWRGDQAGGELRDYIVTCEDGEVVLDAIHRVQATQACAGTARPASAAPARPRSMAARACCA
jgi:hypothetical protein